MCARGRLGVWEREREGILCGDKRVLLQSESNVIKIQWRSLYKEKLNKHQWRSLIAVIYFEIYWLLLKINDLKFKAFGSNLVYENNINFWTSLFFNLILHLHISFSHVFNFAFYHSSEKISLAKFSDKIEK